MATHGKGKPGREHLNKYLETLGLKPGASLEEVNTTYFTLIKRMRENPTEEEEAHLGELRHAYNLLRSAYAPPQSKAPLKLDRRMMIPAMGILTLALLAALVYMNYDSLKLKMTHYNAGAVLRLKSHSEAYGKVVGFESSHRFPVGNPSAAYAIHLSDKDETIWISERVVVNGMVPVSSN